MFSRPPPCGNRPYEDEAIPIPRRGRATGVPPLRSTGMMQPKGQMNSLAACLLDATKSSVAGEPRVTVLMSGGIDSSLVGWLAREYCPAVQAFVIGTRGAPDFESAETAAMAMDLPLERCVVSPGDVAEMLHDLSPELLPADPTLRSVVVAEALSLRAAPGKRVLCGQGADELFLGYAHFRGLSRPEAEARRHRDWTLLVDTEWPRARHLAARWGKDLCSPYLDPRVSRPVLSTPLDPPGADGLTKPVLREIAEALGLPAALCRRRKRAWQYGSGVDKLVRSAARASRSGGLPGDGRSGLAR